jgi:hypothetical protein
VRRDAGPVEVGEDPTSRRKSLAMCFPSSSAMMAGIVIMQASRSSPSLAGDSMSGHGRVLTGWVGETGRLEFPSSSWLSRKAAHRHCGAPKGVVADSGRLVRLGRDVVRRPRLGSRAGDAACQAGAGCKRDEDRPHEPSSTLPAGQSEPARTSTTVDRPTAIPSGTLIMISPSMAVLRERAPSGRSERSAVDEGHWCGMQGQEAFGEWNASSADGLLDRSRQRLNSSGQSGLRGGISPVARYAQHDVQVPLG